MNVIHCESGPYGMSATVIGHYVQSDGITLCGRNTRKGGRWTTRYARKGNTLDKHDCKRCLAKAAKLGGE